MQTYYIHELFEAREGKLRGQIKVPPTTSYDKLMKMARAKFKLKDMLVTEEKELKFMTDLSAYARGSYENIYGKLGDYGTETTI